jgi:hypothetical protein
LQKAWKRTHPESAARITAAVLPSSLIYHPSSAILTGRSGRKVRRKT